MNRSTRWHVAWIVLASLGGCCLLPNRESEDTVPLSSVLDSLKDELTAFAQMKPIPTPLGGTCTSKDGRSLDLVPKKAKVVLKTIAAHQHDMSLGLAAPIGVVKFDPSASGSHSRTQSQTLEVALDVNNIDAGRTLPSKHYPIGAAIASFRDELLKVDHGKTPCLAYGDKSVIKLTLAFDVVKKSTGGFGLELVVFKVSNKETLSNTAAQTIDIDFELVGDVLLQVP
jgi:hypothetical protein